MVGARGARLELSGMENLAQFRPIHVLRVKCTTVLLLLLLLLTYLKYTYNTLNIIKYYCKFVTLSVNHIKIKLKTAKDTETKNELEGVHRPCTKRFKQRFKIVASR